jgi:hypothetical protein
MSTPESPNLPPASLESVPPDPAAEESEGPARASADAASEAADRGGEAASGSPEAASEPSAPNPAPVGPATPARQASARLRAMPGRS